MKSQDSSAGTPAAFCFVYHNALRLRKRRTSAFNAGQRLLARFLSRGGTKSARLCNKKPHLHGVQQLVA